MRIGIVLDDTLDSTDGVQQYVRCIGGWLTSRNHEVYYLVGETKSAENNVFSLGKNIRVAFNGNVLSVPLPVPKKKINKLLRELNLDIIHVQTPYSPFLAGRIIQAAPAQAAVIGTFHILPYTKTARFANAILGKINIATAKRFDAMMSVSQPAQEFAGDLYGFTSTIVANPFIHDIFSTQRRGKKTSNTPLKIVFLGRLVPRKGPLELLKAVEQLSRKKSLPAFQLIIGGKGPLRETLEAFTTTHKLDSIVQFLGFVPESKKAELLQSADIAVFPSTSGESFGISLLEAMAAARGIVLAGDNPGYRSVISSEAQLFNPKDTHAFSKLLYTWIRDDAGRNKAALFQQRYVAQFDVDTIGPRIEQIYKTALQNRTQA